MTVKILKLNVLIHSLCCYQTTAELREQLQSKEREHELALHTLKNQVTHLSAQMSYRRFNSLLYKDSVNGGEEIRLQASR